MKDWKVDGVDMLYRQWFWYRIGSSGGEQILNTLPILSADQPSDSTLDVTYGNSQLRIEAVFSVLGGSHGSGNSDIGEQIKVKNISGQTLDFHFFQMTDFDLNGAASGDTLELGKNLQGLFNEALQTKGNVRFADTVISPGAIHGQAAVNGLLDAVLADSSPTTLNDYAGPVSGDTEWAFQWDVTLAPGASWIMSADKNLYVVVPEPGALSIVGLGLVAFRLVRSRRRVR